MKLCLLRHGLTRGIQQKLYYGATDLPLAPEGIDALRADPPAVPQVRYYFTSGMLRAEQTFVELFGNSSHMILPGMREINFGDFEMRSYEELKDDPAFQRWCEGDNEHNTAPNGESGAAATARALDALAPLLERGEDALIVCHGGIICGLLAHWFGGTRFDYPCAAGHGFVVEFCGNEAERFTAI